MRLSWEVAARSFRRATTYRLATASGVAVNTVFGYLRAYVLIFVAEQNGGSVNDWTTTQVATFAFVSQGFLMVTGAFGDQELAQRIKTGDIVVDLYRPADLQRWWLASWYGRSLFQLFARGIPPVVLGAIAIDLRWPDPWWHWLPFLVAVVLASTLGFGLRFCSGLVTFWLLDNRGVDQLLTMLIAFFAGLLLPLALLPAPLATVADWLPFGALIQLPVEIYLGLHDLGGILVILARQLAWAAAMLLAGRAMLSAATRKLVIQGG